MQNRENAPRIAMINPKGGVGKTAIALNFSFMFDYLIVTNDKFSIINRILDRDRYIVLNENEPLPNIPPGIPIVFDLGGFLDSRIAEAMAMSDYLIIPVLPNPENIQTILDFIPEVRNLCSKPIVIIINQANSIESDSMKMIFNSFHSDIHCFPLRRSKVITRMIDECRSIESISNDGGLSTYHFRNISEQFNEIIRYIFSPK